MITNVCRGSLVRSPFFFSSSFSRLLFHLSPRDGFSERNEGSSKIFEAFTPSFLTGLPDATQPLPYFASPFLSSRERERKGISTRFSSRLSFIRDPTAPTNTNIVVYLSHPRSRRAILIINHFV